MELPKDLEAKSPKIVTERRGGDAASVKFTVVNPRYRSLCLHLVMKSALIIVPLYLATASGFVMRCSNLGKNIHMTDQTQHGESCYDVMAIPRTRVPEAPQGRTDLRYVGRVELPVISSAEWEKARVVWQLNTSVHDSRSS